MGIEFALAIILGYLAGSWLDRRNESYPLWTILLLLFGIATGFAGLIRTAKTVARDLGSDEEADDNNSNGTNHTNHRTGSDKGDAGRNNP